MFGRLSKREIASSLAILVFCLVGDKNSKPLKDGDLAAAICDNITHGFVGMVIWGTVLIIENSFNDRYFYSEIILCGLFSSLIDSDHFLAARSLNLKDATSLVNRPAFHSTTGAIFGCGIILGLSYKLGLNWLYRLSWILISAFLSHHIRDSIRRGFSLWPFGSTKPLPYPLYLLAEVLLPQIINFCMGLLESPDARNKTPSQTIMHV